MSNDGQGACSSDEFGLLLRLCPVAFKDGLEAPNTPRPVSLEKGLELFHEPRSMGLSA